MNNDSVAENHCSLISQQADEIKKLKSENESILEILIVTRDYRDAAQYQLKEAVAECDSLKYRLDEAIDLLSFIKKCLYKNNEYSPLSHQEIDKVLGVGYYSEGNRAK